MNAMIVIHGICVIVCMILVMIVLSSKTSDAQKWLLAGTTFVMINVVGYFFELQSTTVEGMRISVKIQYVGACFCLLCFLCFVDVYNNHINQKLINGIKAFYAVNNLMILLLVFTFEYHTLYYKAVHSVVQNGQCFWIYTPGFFHRWWTVTTNIMGLIILAIAISSAMEQKGERHHEYTLIIYAALMPVIFMILKALGVMGYYDSFPFSMTLTEIFLVVIILRYRLFDAVMTAKDMVLEEIQEGIFVLDRNGEVMYSNRESNLIFPGIDRKKDERVHREIVQFIENHSDGFMLQDHFYKWQSTDIRDNNGIHAGTMYRIMDMTDNYYYTQKLIELKEDAERANEAKSSFLANMSHEIRTPINAVLGMNEMILRECDSDSIKEYAVNINNAGKTLLSIINDILDLSKIESGKMEIVEADYDVRLLLTDIENMISMRAEEKNLIFTIDADETIPTVLHGDEMRIKQCIVNLLTNSVKYTHKGSVSLKLDKTDNNDGSINLWVSVTDTGIGIKEEELHKLFESFIRLDITKNRNVEGTGLGLNITKKLVGMMGGNLTVESVYGEGSTFSFVIVQKVVNQEGIGDYRNGVKKLMEKTLKPAQTFVAPLANVLSVDDNKVNLAVVKGFLKKLKIQCDSVLSGTECIQKVSEKDYDIILLDHMMPEMDGIETLQKLQQKEQWQKQHPAVIALTANAVAGAREEYLRVGFTDYLSKPIDSVKLEEMLAKYLPPDKIEKVEE
ncbi:MAG: histidine kinase N-terminal 7TM domain-containing protein [Lachnospiraceae bacterium]